MLLVIKIGGSCVTYKKEGVPKIRDVFVSKFCKQIREIKNLNKNIKIVIVHGGGSITHPLLDKYGVEKSTENNEVKDGKVKNSVAKIHVVMSNLNNDIVSYFLDEKISAWPIKTSSIAIAAKRNGRFYVSYKSIRTALKNNIIPILHGDFILNEGGNGSIFSGDLLACLVAEKLKADKLIFLTDVDGVYEWYESGKKHGGLISRLNLKKNDRINILDKNDDHSGGMKGKLDYIKNYCVNIDDVVIVNGLKYDNIKNVLEGKKYLGTDVII